MRVQKFAVPLLAAGLVTGCAQNIVQKALAPDPFDYLKRSAVCQVTTPKPGPTGDLVATMTVRSDDGLCALKLNRPDGSHYASFGVSPAPEHGKAFLYNTADNTNITYTPTMGYAGNDSFTAVLISGPGQKRDRVQITAVVDATGVVLPTPPVVAKAPTTTKSTTTSKSHSASKKKSSH